MSIKVDNISRSIYGGNVSHKSRQYSNAENLTKKEPSDCSKIYLGTGLLLLIGLGVEVFGFKSRHLKTFWEKFNTKFNKKPSNKSEANNTVINNERRADISTLNGVADFTNVNQAKSYFESIGIKTIFKRGSENHLSDLNAIKDDIPLLEKNGVAIPKPDSIIIADWHNQNEIRQIFNSLGIPDNAAILDEIGLWGTIERSSDNKVHVLINSSFGNYSAFIHEMGHVHQDLFRTSYWHSKGLSDREFLKKQVEVLGISDVGLHDSGIDMIIRDFGNSNTPSILRSYTGKSVSSSAKAKLKQMFPDINNESDYDKLFTILGKNEKTYIINAKKMVDKMASESGVYAPSKTWENVAEMFQGLNQGKTYSDLVMLMYDICGGGRVPNLVIKGQKYDDYIESLYRNPDLIRQLREHINVKELI